MKFNSVKEYFYKLYNRCCLLTLLPLALFIYLYLEVQSNEIVVFVKDEAQVRLVQGATLTIVMLILTTFHWLNRKKLRKMRGVVSLGDRMDGYYDITLFRIGMGVAASMATAAGFYLTADGLFGLGFLLVLGWMSFQWPTPRRMCIDLKLKGDEKELILHKRDRL